MYPTSPQFDQMMLAESQTVAIKADLYTVGLTQLVAADLQVAGGNVTVDRTAAIRRTCSIDITDQRLIAAFTATDRAGSGPYEIIPYRGFRYPDGSTELIPQGVFRVSTARVTDRGQPTLTIGGVDRSRAVARARLTDVWYISPGTAFTDAAVALIDNRLPFTIPVGRMITTVDPATTSQPIVYHESDDPWARAQELLAAVGSEVYFDADGWLVAREEPDPSIGQPVIQLVDGDNAIILPDFVHELSDEPGVNGILMTGEGSSADQTGAIPRALVWDADPNSPTYYLGPYGMVPDFVQDPAQTATSIVKAATGKLRRVIGRTETFTVAAVPHSALDASDIARLVRTASGVDTTVLVESLVMPLDVTTAMTLTCRSQRAV